MRRLFSISLLVILGCPFLGARFFLLHRKYVIREQVKTHILAGVGESELVRLSFSLQDAETKLAWEHAKEFEYRGEMYDVVKSEASADSITYWCIWDKAETEINRRLETLTALATGNDPPCQNCLHDFFSFLKSLFFTPAAEVQPLVADGGSDCYFYLPFQSAFFSVPPAPPPEVI